LITRDLDPFGGFRGNRSARAQPCWRSTCHNILPSSITAIGREVEPCPNPHVARSLEQRPQKREV
jgi:hypothetical protein